MSDTILVRLPDGSLVNKSQDEVEADDRVVVDDAQGFSDLDAARRRLDAAIEAAGGLERWRSTKALL